LREKIHVADNELVAAENAFKTIEKQHLSFTIALVSRVTISSFSFSSLLQYLFCAACTACIAQLSLLYHPCPLDLLGYIRAKEQYEKAQRQKKLLVGHLHLIIRESEQRKARALENLLKQLKTEVGAAYFSLSLSGICH
jgi:hypothetical protein